MAKHMSGCWGQTKDKAYIYTGYIGRIDNDVLLEYDLDTEEFKTLLTAEELNLDWKTCTCFLYDNKFFIIDSKNVLPVQSVFYDIDRKVLKPGPSVPTWLESIFYIMLERSPIIFSPKQNVSYR